MTIIKENFNMAGANVHVLFQTPVGFNLMEEKTLSGLLQGPKSTLGLSSCLVYGKWTMGLLSRFENLFLEG